MGRAGDTFFGPGLFKYLRDLKRHNTREWFLENKTRYEEVVKEPALGFIAAFDAQLGKISPEFLAIPKAVGGSLFRIQRDVRFSKDKSPYKTHVGIRFLHRDAKNVHAPLFYLHLEPGGCFAGIGVWHPEPPTLEKIRQAVAEDPGTYRRAVGAARFKKRFRLGGDSLKRPPRGYDPEHPLIEELKRKDFVADCPLTEKEIVRPGFDRRLGELFKDGAGYVRYLCKALGAPF
jgi:uncharacterized protein (TIGR02453 family)